MVLKVGVTCARYVSLSNARPWVIHAYRNIKGRGLHVDEDTENTVPIDKVDEYQIKPSIPDPHPYLYTEPGNEQNGSAEGNESSKKRRKNDNKTEENTSGDNESQTTKTSLREASRVKRRKMGPDVLETSDNTSNTEIDTFHKTDQTLKYSNTKTESSAKHTDRIVAESLEDHGLPETVITGNVKDVNDFKTDLSKDDESKGDTSDDTKSVKDVDAKILDNNDTTTDMMKSRRSRKRKFPGETQKSIEEVAPAISTYDKVRLVIQPWRKPEGSINKPILKMMMESVLLYLMMNPGSPEDVLVKRYAPYLQPMILRNIVEILEDIGCVTRQFIKKRKTTIFSKPTLPRIVSMEEEDCTIVMLPTEDCVIKMGLFGREVFPNVKWPETTNTRAGIVKS